jgi:hypothetical protein
MTLDVMARFLDEHPDFAPLFQMNIKGGYFIEGFDSPDHKFFSIADIEQMLAAKPAQGFED